jgi:hypothetical protein
MYLDSYYLCFAYCLSVFADIWWLEGPGQNLQQPLWRERKTSLFVQYISFMFCVALIVYMLMYDIFAGLAVEGCYEAR